MKTLKYFFIFFALLPVCLFSQVPEAFKYQTVVRNGEGAVIANQEIDLKLVITDGGVDGTVIYLERQTVETNEFGLATAELGRGSALEGDFETIDWAAGGYFLRVEVDPEKDGSYVLVGGSPLLSVPYAMHAKTVDNPDDADADPENELQNLAIDGNELSISDGNMVTLPFSTSFWNKDVNDNLLYTDLNGSGYPDVRIKSNDNSAFLRIDKGVTDRWGQVLFQNGGLIKGRVGLDNADNLVFINGSGGFSLTPAGTFNFNAGLNLAEGKFLGIGTEAPSYELDIRGVTHARANIKAGNMDAMLIIDRKVDNRYAEIEYRTDGTTNYYTGLLRDNNYTISRSYLLLKGLQVKENGNVQVSDTLEFKGELHNTPTGDANMVPFAYGYVTAKGSVATDRSTSNVVSANYNGLTHRYELVVDGLDDYRFVINVTPYSSIAVTSSIIITETGPCVGFTKLDDSPTYCGFYFVIFQK